MLICPKCKEKLIVTNNTYKCLNNHSYDIAKEGYVNLLLSKTDSGDDKTMVNARALFLSKGYYKPLAIKLSNILSNYINESSYILDGGCGEGYYDNILKEHFPNIIGYDISKEAVKKASKLNKDLSFFVASSNSIPICDKQFDCFLNIFTPSFENEANRILKDNGIYVIISPKDNHLIELKNAIYDHPYLNNESNIIFQNFIRISKESVTFRQEIPHDDLVNLIKMTPYLYKTKKDDLKKIDLINSLNLTLSFNISIYKKRTN